MPALPSFRTNDIPEAIAVDEPPLRIYPTPSSRGVRRTDDEDAPGKGPKPLAYLRYRWVLVVFLGTLVGSILAGLTWLLVPAKYTTRR